MSFIFYFIFSMRPEEAEAYGWEIHIHILKHHKGWLSLMRTYVMNFYARKREKKKVIPVHRIIHGFPLSPLSESAISVWDWISPVFQV